MYIAHINENTGERESVREHLCKTAELCKEYAVPELKDIAWNIGMLHDIGKYQPSFQRRIKGDDKIRIEHSICGAIEAMQKCKGKDFLGMFMAYCIAGHHSGIPNGGTINDDDAESTLQGRLKRNTEDYSIYEEEIGDLLSREMDFKSFASYISQDCKNMEQVNDKLSFMTRFAFSCLTDADSVATAEFCREAVNRHLSTDFEKCLHAVNQKLASFNCENELQRARSVLQDQVFAKTDTDSEIYLLNMPTGSGKTLCSVKFALERAIRLGKKRIIYIIPYNSIIEQTAKTFDDLFGKYAEILRHQSTFSYEDYDEDYRTTARFATENWDADFIITTSVQFFESIYSSKRGKLRKLHNMADSILIFDEAHMMPTEYLQPCLQAISYITKYLNSEAMLLTATMPDYGKLIKEYALKDSRIIDLIPDKTHFHMFDKCEYEYRESITDEELLSKAGENPSSLIVVNRRADARRLYEMCGGKKYHLSTYMTSFDRSRVIDEIQKTLKELEQKYPQGCEVPEEERITVISTSLIEAGVDLDFHAVFREINGLDNILQAGGRCNREGKRAKGKVLVFGFESGKKVKNEQQNISKGLFKKYENVACKESIEEYYEKFYFDKQEDITGKSMHNYCNSYISMPFRKYDEDFEIIDSKTESVVVGIDEESKALIEQLRIGVGSSRKLQKYTCTIYKCELEDLQKQHVIEDLGNGIWCLTNPDYYDKNIGIKFEGCDIFV